MSNHQAKSHSLLSFLSEANPPIITTPQVQSTFSPEIIEFKVIKILNAFCGIGGNRLLIDFLNLYEIPFEITAIDINKKITAEYKRQFPDDKVITGDAYDYIQHHADEYDIIWASPQCTTLTALANANNRFKVRPYADLRLYSLIMWLEDKRNFKGIFAIENVVPGKHINHGIPFLPAQKIDRHLFWSNITLDTEISIPKMKYFAKPHKSEKYGDYTQRLKDYIGINISKNIYLPNSHDPARIFRNCVYPELGLHVYQQLINSIMKQLGYDPILLSCDSYENQNTNCRFEVIKRRGDLSSITHEQAMEYLELGDFCEDCINMMGF